MHIFRLFFLNAYQYQKSEKRNIARAVTRTFAAPGMLFFVIIVYGFKSLTIFLENSILDAVGALNPPLITSGLLLTSNKLILCRLLKYKIISFENDRNVETSLENFSLYWKSHSSTASTVQIIYAYIYIYIYIRCSNDLPSKCVSFVLNIHLIVI